MHGLSYTVCNTLVHEEKRMFLLRHTLLKLFLLGFWALNLIITTSACSKEFDIEKENKKRREILLDKIEKDIKLSSDEIANLGGILLWNEEYDKGIEIFEKFKDLEVYENERYEIHFELSVFYTQKAKGVTERQERQQLIKKAEEYLMLGFSATPERALAYNLRAKAYAVMGCMKKAKSDIREAINIAKTKEIILWDDGMYLSKERFIEFVTKDLESFERFEDNCMLK